MKIGDTVYLKITPDVQNACYCFGDLSDYDYIIAKISYILQYEKKQ